MEIVAGAAATEASKTDGGALGMRLVTNGELDAHREESPELIGSEAVEDICHPGANSGFFCQECIESASAQFLRYAKARQPASGSTS